MSEQKKTFEAPVLTALSVEPINNVASSGWLTNAYSFNIPDIANAKQEE